MRSKLKDVIKKCIWKQKIYAMVKVYLKQVKQDDFVMYSPYPFDDETFTCYFKIHDNLWQFLIKSLAITLSEEESNFHDIICEYWIDQNSFHYFITSDYDGAVTITKYVSCKFINELVVECMKRVESFYT